VDTGTATTKEIYEVLGKPEYISTYVDSGGVRRYRYLVTAFATHNAYVNYTIPRRERNWFGGVSLRFGVNNVTDIDPPLADSDTGYQRGAGTNPRGRTFYSQLSKNF
jgi:outer membrane receptor protein involved in Fe transport